MGLFQVVCLGLLAVSAWTQDLRQDCSAATNPVTVSNTQDASALAASLNCSNGDFDVEWVGEVFVEDTIRVTLSTSLTIIGAGPGAIANGGYTAQLFELNGGAILHLSDMTLTNGYAPLTGGNYSSGGAISASQSSVLLGGNMSFISNSADYGGAIYLEASTLSSVGDDNQFISNNAGDDGGAIYVTGGSTVSWVGDGTEFVSNNASGSGGAVRTGDSALSWNGDGTMFISNSAGDNAGAIRATDGSKVFWDGDNTLFHNNSAGLDGGAIVVTDGSNVSWDGDGTMFSDNSAMDDAGAIRADDDSTVTFVGDDTQFISNNGGDQGGAIYVIGGSTVSWVGDGTEFVSNAAITGGALLVYGDSKVSWVGDGTEFVSNSVSEYGGAIAASHGAEITWHGDGTLFLNNSGLFIRDIGIGYAARGGAIAAIDTALSWVGDGTQFTSNFADGDGGAIWAAGGSSVSWTGDGTNFSFNDASGGGAVAADDGTSVSWIGDGTLFVSNSASVYGGAISVKNASTLSWIGGANGTKFFSNHASSSGGGLYAIDASTSVVWDGPTTWRKNTADYSGGALYLVSISPSSTPYIGGLFIENYAGVGGAVFMSSCLRVNFTDFVFESNWASGTGGAVVMHTSSFSSFNRCSFFNNTGENGGAVSTMLGVEEFSACNFKYNSAENGGALRIGGHAELHDCNMVANYARVGPALFLVGGSTLELNGNTSLHDNEVMCDYGTYRLDTAIQESTDEVFNTMCHNCGRASTTYRSGSRSTDSGFTSTCEAPPDHTYTIGENNTLDTLIIAWGYWRATNESGIILPCYNADACTGGETGAADFCATGYNGPYCAVCGSDYVPSFAHTCTRCSSSRREGFVAVTIVGAVVAAIAIGVIFECMISIEVEGDTTGCFLYRRVLRAVPVQALKIIVVVWQISTQFADAADVTYPGVYQRFLRAINVINFDLGSVLAVGCVWPSIDFHDRLLLSTTGPLVGVGFLAMTYRVAMCRQRTSEHAVLERIRHTHQKALLLLTFLVYSSVSSMVFQTFACETLDDDVEYLRADYRIHCTDTKHKAFEAYAWIMIFIYPVGIPLLYAFLLFQRRDVLADKDADKTVAQSIAGLWEAYTPESFYYEVVECARRIMLTGVVVFIFPNDAAQFAITMLIAFFFSLVFEVMSPYKSQTDIWLSRGGHVIVFLSMFDALLLKVEVSDERDQSQSAFAGVLVAGNVLMVVAIVVEVVGICFTSRKKAAEGEETSERPRMGSDNVPVLQSARTWWRSIWGVRSVSEMTGPTRAVSGNLVTTGGA
ncbi:unnamed protein product [Ectocarpus sp. 4 AP-2014]